MLPKTIENALANGYTTEGCILEDKVCGNTIWQTGVWELTGDNLEDQIEVPYTAVFKFGKPRRPRVSPNEPTFAFEGKVEHPATRKDRSVELPIRLVK